MSNLKDEIDALDLEAANVQAAADRATLSAPDRDLAEAGYASSRGRPQGRHEGGRCINCDRPHLRDEPCQIMDGPRDAFCPRCGAAPEICARMGCDPLVCGDCGTPVSTSGGHHRCHHRRRTIRASEWEREERAAVAAPHPRGAVYEPETQTVRAVPQNYCLANLDHAGAFQIYTQDAATWPILGELARALPYGRARADGHAVARALAVAWRRFGP